MLSLPTLKEKRCRAIGDSEPSGETGRELCQTLLNWSGFISL